jgi:hypothetical protein
MNKTLKVVAAVAVVVLVTVILAEGFDRLVLKSTPANRLSIYAVQREVRRGMEAKDVAEIVARLTNERVRVRWEEASKGLRLSTQMGFFHGGCQLTARFVEGRLVSSKVRGTEGPDERLHDAPADIE